MEISGTIKKLGQGAWSAKEDSIGVNLYSVVEVDQKSFYNVQATDLVSSYLNEGEAYTLLFFRTLSKRHLLALKNKEGKVVTALQSLTIGSWLGIIFTLLFLLLFVAFLPFLMPIYLGIVAWAAYVIWVIKKFEAKHR